LRLENVAGIDADLMKHSRKVGSIAHEPAGCRKFTYGISRRIAAITYLAGLSGQKYYAD
jgi:hypothetical protein